MLLTAGREEGENRLLIVMDWKEGKEWEVGHRVHIMRVGTALTGEGISLQTTSLSRQSPPAPSLYCSNHFAKPSSNLFI